jgi:hypothetical protein
MSGCLRVVLGGNKEKFSMWGWSPTWVSSFPVTSLSQHEGGNTPRPCSRALESALLVSPGDIFYLAIYRKSADS